jgi:hypothetical protein
MKKCWIKLPGCLSDTISNKFFFITGKCRQLLIYFIDELKLLTLLFIKPGFLSKTKI